MSGKDRRLQFQEEVYAHADLKQEETSRSRLNASVSKLFHPCLILRNHFWALPTRRMSTVRLQLRKFMLIVVWIHLHQCFSLSEGP